MKLIHRLIGWEESPRDIPCRISQWQVSLSVFISFMMVRIFVDERLVLCIRIITFNA